MMGSPGRGKPVAVFLVLVTASSAAAFSAAAFSI